MKKSCFLNYIDDIEKDTTSERFLSKYKEILANLENNPEIEKDLKIYIALSNKIRFLIFKLIEIHPMCTCALAKIFGKNDATITHHLKKLDNAGLISGKKQGYYTIYYSKKALIDQLSSF